jgi:hypothetical protein
MREGGEQAGHCKHLGYDVPGVAMPSVLSVQSLAIIVSPSTSFLRVWSF